MIGEPDEAGQQDDRAEAEIDGDFPGDLLALAAAENADWSVPNFAANLIDTAGAKSWPIVSPTFILLPKDPKDAARSANVTNVDTSAGASGLRNR